jgi:hypothetical protein
MAYEIFLFGIGCVMGFNIGWFYCQMSYMRYKKTVDSIERTKVDIEWDESFKKYKEWVGKNGVDKGLNSK